MRRFLYAIIPFLFPFYLGIVLLTKISLVGFWTDIIASLSFSTLTIWFLFHDHSENSWYTRITKTVNSVCVFIVLGISSLYSLNPFSYDTLKMRSFYFQSVNERLFNAYFKPVGSYSGGYGNFWITETPKYFPLIEWQIYQDRAVQHDFNKDRFEDQPVDNNEVVRYYIKEKVIVSSN